MVATPATNRQIPDQSILDFYHKQAYLGNRYTYIIQMGGGNATEQFVLLITNPLLIGTAFPNQVGIFCDYRRGVSNTAGVPNITRLYSNPTVTSVGSTVTATNVRPASPNTSIALIQTAPVVSSSGTLIEVFDQVADGTTFSDQLYILDPGQTILISSQHAVAEVSSIQISWNEQ